MPRGASAIAGLADLALGGRQAELDGKRLGMEMERLRYERELQRQERDDARRREQEAFRQQQAAAINQMVQGLTGAGVNAIGQVGGLVQEADSRKREQTRYDAEQARIADQTAYQRGQDKITNDRAQKADDRAETESVRAGLDDAAQAALGQLEVDAGLRAAPIKEAEKAKVEAEQPEILPVFDRILKKADSNPVKAGLVASPEQKQAVVEAAVAVKLQAPENKAAETTAIKEVVAGLVAADPKLKGRETELEGRIRKLQESKMLSDMAQKRADEAHKSGMATAEQLREFKPQEFASEDQARKDSAAARRAELAEQARHNKATEENARLAAEARAKAAAEKAGKLSEGDKKRLEKKGLQDAMLTQLDEMIKGEANESKNDALGPVDTPLGKAASAIGMGGAKTVAGGFDYTSINAPRIHELLGAAQTPSEYKRIEAMIPLPTDFDDTRRVKLQKLKEEIVRQRDAIEARTGGQPAEPSYQGPDSDLEGF